MISSAISLIGGILSFNFFPLFPLSITLICIAIVVVLFLRQKNKKRILPIIIFFIFGLFYGYLRDSEPVELRLPQGDVIIEGTVIDVPEMSGEKGRFTIDDVYIEGKYLRGKIRLSILPDIFYRYETVKVFLPSYADRIRAVVRLGEPHILHNPGVYSYDLKKRGIIAQGYVKHIEVIGREKGGFIAWINRKRQELGRIIDNSLSIESASLHKAIIPGLKKGITQDMRDSFSATGLAHLLSISGTHFGLLAFIIFKFIKMVFKFLPERILTKMTLYITPTQIAIILTLPVLALYALLSGANIPTIRSFIMVFIYMLALYLGRRDQWLNSLSIAAIIVLLWQPDAVFEVSFQLSFMAVLFIGYVLEERARARIQATEPIITRDIKSLLKNISERMKTAILITVAAVLGTAPFVALYFKQFSLISPITNLIVTPLVCFIILPLGFFNSFIALLFNMSIMPFNWLIDVLTGFTLNLIRIFSDIPYSNLHVHNPSFFLIVLYFMIFIIRGRFRRKILYLVLVIGFYLLTPYLHKDDGLRVTFLDVRQGESSVIELPKGEVMLIDGGKAEPNMGRMVVAPYLWSKGIKRIKYLVLSHPHPDHYGGLMYIIDNFKVDEIWLNGRKTEEAEEFFTKITERKIPYRILKRGDLLESRDYRIYVLHPYDVFYAGSLRGDFSNQNNDSLVLKIQYNDISVLFTGDIETEAEENLIHLGKWLRSDIIKVPHHGGRTSSTEEFLQMVRPKVAVISVGRNNPFNHPHIETIRRYKDVGAQVFRTERDGAITLLSVQDGTDSYEIRTYWDTRFREVKALRDEIRNVGLLFR